MPHKLLSLVVALASVLGGCTADSDHPSISGVSAKDVDRCISVASHTGANLQANQTEHFILLSSAGDASAASMGLLLEQVRQRFYASFENAGFSLQPSPDKLACVCVDSYGQLDSYARLADDVDASWMGGYYSQRTNCMVIVRFPQGERSQPRHTPSIVNAAPGGSYGDLTWDGLNLRTVTHELAHQLAFTSGLQRRGVEYPFWLTEGLATNFEADDSGAYGLFRDDAGYRSRLILLKANGRLIPLCQFVQMTESPSGQNQAARDAYAQAWGLFHYLLQHHRRELKEYMTGWSAAFQSPQRRFTEIFGPIDPLERDFQRSLGE